VPNKVEDGKFVMACIRKVNKRDFFFFFFFFKFCITDIENEISIFSTSYCKMFWQLINF
jgi:hypothetical protein